MDLRAVGMGVAFALMWSSAFTAARVIVTHAPPLTSLTFRFLLGGCVAIAIAWALGQTARLTPAQWRATVLFGIGQNALYLGLNFIAMQWVEASVAAIIASALPLLVAAATWAIWRERLRTLGVAGLAAGFGGVFLILGARITGGADPLGVFLCILSAFAITFATLMLRGTGGGRNVLMIVGLQMLVGAAALSVPAFLFEPWEVRWTWPFVTAFLYTALVPGVLATWVWFLLVQRIGAVRAATFHFLNPPLGVAIAALLLGEGFGWADALGVVVVMLGILAVQIDRAGPRPPPAA